MKTQPRLSRAPRARSAYVAVVTAVLGACVLHGTAAPLSAQANDQLRLFEPLKLAFEAALDRYTASLRGEELFWREFVAATDSVAARRARGEEDAEGRFLGESMPIQERLSTQRAEVDRANQALTRAFNEFRDSLSVELSHWTDALDRAVVPAERDRIQGYVDVLDQRLAQHLAERSPENAPVVRPISVIEWDPRDSPPVIQGKVFALRSLIAEKDSTIARTEAERETLQSLIRSQDASNRARALNDRFEVGVTAVGVARPPGVGDVAGGTQAEGSEGVPYGQLPPAEQLAIVEQVLEALEAQRTELQRQLARFPNAEGSG